MKMKSFDILGGVILTGDEAFGKAKVDPRDYRELDDKQLAHLRFIANMADQKFNDWSKMDSSEPGQTADDSYRYQLAMMSYAANLANYYYTPAYRDHYQHVSERLIAKMMRFAGSSFWDEVSRGVKLFDPELVKLSEGWHDPVIKQNIMYSGHLFQMVATHAMLYNSDKYYHPVSLTFVYAPRAGGMGKEEFVYDTPKLAKGLRSQVAYIADARISC